MEKEKGNFEIVISDGYCSYKYQLFPKEGDNLSIDDIIKATRKALNDESKGLGKDVTDN